MSDEELNVAEDVGGGAEATEAAGAQKRTGLLPGVLITILKWAAIALGFVILGATTTLITYRIVSGRTESQAPIGRREAYSAGREFLAYFDLETIRGSTSDETQTIFSGIVRVGYAEDKKEIADELVKRKIQIRNAIMIKLSRKTYEELRPDRLEQVQSELTVVVNGILTSGKVSEVLLDDFTVVR